MSFILDALKKSENERQRQIGPSLADIPMRRAKADRPWWAVAVAALLVVNLGVLIVVLTRNDKPDSPATVQPAPQSPPQTTPSQQQPRPAPQSSTPRANVSQAEIMGSPPRVDPSVRSLADEANADADLLPEEAMIDPALAGAATVPAGPPVVRQITPPNVAPLPAGSTFAARTREPAHEEMLPTHSSLTASGTNLPDMKLDIHVYSAQPAERFVFVNMRKYVEGQSLSEGPLLERITPDGAVLNQRGTRFLLPRQ
jgi:general secretion pathway protein B